MSVLVLTLLCGVTNSQQLDTAKTNGLIRKAYEQLDKFDYDSATFYFQSAATIYEAHEVWEKYFEMQIEISGNLWLASDLDGCKSLALRVIEESEDKIAPNHKIVAQAHGRAGTVYSYKNQFDSAFYHHSKAISILNLDGENTEELARQHNNFGQAYYHKASFDTALFHFRKSVALWFSSGDSTHRMLSAPLGNIGNVYWYKGRFDSTIWYYNKSTEIDLLHYGEIDPGTAQGINNLGYAYSALGDEDKAVAYFKRALEIRRQILGESHRDIAESYNNIGFMYSKRGYLDSAIYYHSNALQARLETFGELSKFTADSYGNLGAALVSKGLYQEAEIYFEKSKQIREELFKDEPHPDAANHYGHLGDLFVAKEDYESAVENYRKGMSYLEKTGLVPDDLGYNSIGMSTAFLQLGELDSAWRYSLLAVKVLTDLNPNHSRLGEIQIIQSKILQAKGDLISARRILNRSLEINKTHLGGLHIIRFEGLNELGKLLLRLGEADSALSSFTQAISLNLRDRVGINPGEFYYYNLSPLQLLSSMIGKAQAHDLLFTNSNSQQQLDLAFESYQKADTILTNMQRYQFGQQDRIAINSGAVDLYRGGMQSALKLYHRTENADFLDWAFYFQERGKSRVLSQHLYESTALAFLQIPDSLLRLEERLKADQSFYSVQLSNARNREDPNELILQTVTDKLIGIRQQYDELISLLERDYPSYFEAKYHLIDLEISSYQEKLQEDDLLISYTTSDTSLVSFVLSNTEAKVVTSKDGAELRSLIEEFRELINPRSKDLFSKIVPYSDVASRLYQILLQKALGGPMAKPKRLKIIPDGTIGYLPFEAILSAPATADAGFSDLQYLVRDFIIQYGFSSTLILNPQEIASSENIKYVGFAPSYTATEYQDDQALGPFRSEVSELAWNDDEVSAAAKIFEGRTLTGNQATEPEFKSIVSDYQIVHLAMHAIVDDENPLNSKFVFSRSDSTDGYLHTYELYNLQLNAQLAVLSACNTGYGKLVNGEGIISLARAFAYGGCPSIVMSHWDVDDEATKDLISLFYKNIGNGMSKDEALRQAKLDYLEKADVFKSHPFYWGGFVLIGDNRPLQTAGYGRQAIVIAMILLVVGYYLLVGRQKNSQA